MDYDTEVTSIYFLYHLSYPIVIAQGGIWGAICSILMESMDSADTVFRMMDLKTKDDLKFVRATEPMRERGMSIHDGKVFTSPLRAHVHGRNEDSRD